jgi:hypothetical protein
MTVSSFKAPGVTRHASMTSMMRSKYRKFMGYWGFMGYR